MEQTQTLIQVISLVAGLYSVAWGFIGWPMKITPAAALRFGIANLLVMVGVWLTLRRQVESTYLAYQVADVVLMIGFTCSVPVSSFSQVPNTRCVKTSPSWRLLLWPTLPWGHRARTLWPRLLCFSRRRVDHLSQLLGNLSILGT